MSEHPDHVQAYRKSYYAKNKERIKQRAHDWYYRNRNPATKYKECARQAIRRNVEFSISLEEFELFWQVPCHYCGAPIDSISLDRVDNAVGYRFENVTSCCLACNIAKHTMSAAEFVDLCARVAFRHAAPRG